MRRVILLLLLGLALPALCALPPLSSKELKKESKHIVIGYVQSVTETVVAASDGKDTLYKLEVKIQKRLKGSLKSGSIVTIECRQTKERPDGWAGPQGQNEIPELGTFVQLFIRDTADGRLELLEPNGWEKV